MKSLYIFSCFWKSSEPGRGRGYSKKFYTGKLHPEIQTLTLLYTIFSEKAPLSYTRAANNGRSTDNVRSELAIGYTIYKCLNNDSSPKYLKDMLLLRQSKYSLRGTNILSLCKPVTTTYGLNSFRYFASKTWNSLSNNVRSEHTLTGFRRLLKAISF